MKHDRYAAQAKGYSLTLDPAGIRALTADAITGALAFGYQGINPPPDSDHWLAPFWEIGRESADKAQQPVSGADELAELVELLREIRPSYGDVGTRDVDVTAQQARIDRAIELLSQPQPSGNAREMPPLPLHSDAAAAKAPTSIERFVADNEPAGDDDELFRTQLEAALQEAFELGRAALAAQASGQDREDAQPKLKVVIHSFAESNGKRNWTALLLREQRWDGLPGNCGGITVGYGEYWNRVAYEAERTKYLLGLRETEPCILDYGDDIETPEQWKGEAIDHARRIEGDGE